MHRFQIDKPLLPLYDEMMDLYRQLFKELDRRGYIRKGPSHRDREKLSKIWDMSRDLGQTLNYMYSLFDPKDPHREDRMKKLNQLGLTDHHITYLCLQSMLSTFLVNVESVFRFSFLFFLNDRFFNERSYKKATMTVSSLLKELKKVYSPAAEIAGAFDQDIRNSLAHGSFWFENGKWCITTDAHMKRVKCFELLEVMKKFKRANTAAMAFTDVLLEEINKGTFRA